MEPYILSSMTHFIASLTYAIVLAPAPVVVQAAPTLVSAETLEPLPSTSMGLLIETRKNYNG